MAKKGWNGESQRHSAARKGIKSKVKPLYIGSQVREKIENADEGYKLISKKGNEVILYNSFTDTYEAWYKSDDFAGYTLEINGKGYEFAHSFPKDYKPNRK